MKKFHILFAVVAFLLAPKVESAGLPDKLRVLSVDLQKTLIGTPGVPGGEVAQELRTLLEKADPDVICLQGVTDWETCERICKLKPGLRVLTCSAFAGQPENESRPQVAILARDRAVISWVEQISGDNGFAFALVQAGTRKLGVFSLQTQASQGAFLPATDRVLAEILKLEKFPQNRPDAFLVTGSPLAKSSAVIDAGLQTIAPDPTAKTPPGRFEFWVKQAGFIARPRSIAIPGLTTTAIICDFDASSSFSSKFAYQTPLLFAGETPASLQPASPAPPATVTPETRSLAWPVAITVSAVLLICLVLFRGQRSAVMPLVPLNSPEGVVLANQVDPVRLNLLAWFKSLFVQRLLAQRQHLLDNEDEATRRTLVIEEKLSNLQSSLQNRISAYETRIERLEQELTAATVENRDLIRSQIDLLKEKVAKAKEEQVFRRN